MSGVEPHVAPELVTLRDHDDWSGVIDEVGDGLLAVSLGAPQRCDVSKMMVDAFERARLDPAFATVSFAAIDIDDADEYFLTDRGFTSVPCLQFVKNGYLLSQFTGGNEIRLRSELTRILAALRL